MSKTSWPSIRKRASRGTYVIDLRKVGGGQVTRNSLTEARAFASKCREQYGRLGSDSFQTEETPSSITFKELFLELQKAQRKRDVSNAHLLGTKYQLTSFVVAHMNQKVDELSHLDIEKWLDQEKYNCARTKLNVIRHLGMLFNYAVRMGYIEKNPISKIQRPKQIQKMPENLKANQVERIIEHAFKKDIVMVPKLAIGFFAGLRTAELHRLDWSDIKLESNIITVRPEVAKTGVARHVTISDNLRQWLLPLRKEKGSLGLKKKAFDTHRRTICKRLGIKWPNNAMRHTFATYHVAMHSDASKTAFELGHTQGVQLLYRNYRGLAFGDEAKSYWNIQPDREAGKVVRFVA